MSIKVKQRNAQPVSRLLTNSSSKNSNQGELSPLISKANAIAEAQAYLEKSLPIELKGHLLVGGYTDKNLTLLTDKAVWLTWLRFEKVRLLQLINTLPELRHIDALTFKVRPIKRVKVASHQRRFVSPEAAQHIRECADYTEYPELKAALERLATRTLAPDSDT